MKLNEIQSPLLMSNIKSILTIVNAIKKHFPAMIKVGTRRYKISINSASMHTYLLGTGPYTGKRAMYFLENLLGPPASNNITVYDQENITIKQIQWILLQVAMYAKISVRISYPIGEDETCFNIPVNLRIAINKT